MTYPLYEELNQEFILWCSHIIYNLSFDDLLSIGVEIVIGAIFAGSVFSAVKKKNACYTIYPVLHRNT